MLPSATPQYVEHSPAFLADTPYLGDWRDLKTDINMKWSATRTYYFQKIKDQLARCSSESHMYKATRLIYCHKDDADFHKIIVAVIRFNGDHLSLVYV